MNKTVKELLIHIGVVLYAALIAAIVYFLM